MKLIIKGMMCEHCAKRVENALREKGAENIEIRLADGTAEFDADKPVDIFKSAVEDAGYDVE